MPRRTPRTWRPDFHLFGKLKRDLAAREFNSTEPLLSAIRKATNSIGRAELESVLDAWECRLSKCTQMKGEYVTSAKSSISGENLLSPPQTEMPNNDRTAYDSVISPGPQAKTTGIGTL
jgi:hypothetical protein